EHGHETMMVTTGDPAMERPANLVLMRAPDYKAGSALSRLVNLPSSIYDLGKKRQMADILDSFKPDVMHVFSLNVHMTPSLVQAAYEVGVPVVGTFNDYRHI